jgi:hypothetical protein
MKPVRLSMIPLTMILMLVFLLAACAPVVPATEVVLPKASPTATTEIVVLTWERTGGFAGFCDKVIVYASGSVNVSSCTDWETNFQLTEAQRIQLDNWLQTFKPVEFNQSDPAVADAMSFHLFMAGNGAQEADEETTRLIFKFAAELQEQGNASFNAPPEKDEAGQALHDYLTALNSGDYTLAAKLYGGKTDLLETWNSDITGNLPALFERACTQNGLVCMSPRTITYRSFNAGDGGYNFFVEFSNPDGTLFTQGPCCGETGGPSFTRFTFLVIKTESGYAVMDLPPYVP